ncbi:MAG: sensor histidine kinase, partial [bacterium]
IETKNDFEGRCGRDREKVEAVFEELIVNAVRASPDESSIEIRIHGGEGMVTIEMRDRAGGIPEDQLETIFEPFITLGDSVHHMSGTFEHGAKGIGIGLSTAKMWVELHRGTIQAQNNADGRGCTFTVKFPCEVGPAGPPGGSAEQ